MDDVATYFHVFGVPGGFLAVNGECSVVAVFSGHLFDLIAVNAVGIGKGLYDASGIAEIIEQELKRIFKLHSKKLFVGVSGLSAFFRHVAV